MRHRRKRGTRRSWALAEVARQWFSKAETGVTTIPLASQESFLADSKTITSIRQNGTVWVRNLAYYFVDKQSAAFRFFALPGDGTVLDVFGVPSAFNMLLSSGKPMAWIFFSI